MTDWLWDYVWYPWFKRPYLWIRHPRRMLHWRRTRLTGERIYELGNYQSIGPIKEEPSMTYCANCGIAKRKDQPQGEVCTAAYGGPHVWTSDS